jgi:FkbM family methyltransferase
MGMKNMFLFKWLILLAKPVVSHFPRAVTLYRGVRDQLKLMDEPKPTPWGFKLAGNAAMTQGIFEPTETEIVRKLLKEVDILVNVGANVGYYCCHALSMGIPVIAFEPMPRNLHFLYKNIKANEWVGVEIFPIALSNNVDILEIYGDDTGASLLKGWAGTPEDYKTTVPCSTMDTVLNSRLSGKKALILVDIEGAEKWMLEGARIMLANDPKPIWLVEIMTKDHQPEPLKINPNLMSTFNIFAQNGYNAYSADQEMRPITMEYVENVSSGNLEFSTYNFLFSASEINY